MNKKRSALKRRLRANQSCRYELSRCALYGVRQLSVLTDLLQTTNKALRQSAQAPEFATWVDRSRPEKPRDIQDPRGTTERLHYRICELLDRVIRPEFLHSATRKRSSITNASQHVSHGPCVTTDMKSFYEATSTKQVEEFFSDSLNMAPDLARKLANLCTTDGHLPTGSPLSPLLSYWAHHQTFDKIHELVVERGVVMTVYVDDMAFSGAHASLALLRQVKHKLRLRGLETHKDKSFGRGQFKHITGAAVNGRGIHVPNRRLKQIVDDQGVLAKGEFDAETVASLRRKLSGRIASASAISRKTAAWLKRRDVYNPKGRRGAITAG